MTRSPVQLRRKTSIVKWVKATMTKQSFLTQHGIQPTKLRPRTAHTAGKHVIKQRRVKERYTNTRIVYEHHMISDKWHWEVTLDEL